MVVAPYAPCLSCQACDRGHFSLCENIFDTFLEPGGFAEVVRVPKRIVEQALLHIPTGLDFETASLTEPLACCLHGLDVLAIKAGQSLLVMGDSPMGLLQAVAAKTIGAEPIILSGMTPARLDFARRIVD
ncbi:MAG: alcohol dehydrogenase catalytic domain-containing protein [Anaerolineales bacterium]|nr:alcohol dehydrogenase catalytic domain-containing protein [Anaerolineales bacterium]